VSSTASNSLTNVINILKGCNDRFHEIVGVTRQDLPIFEQWMSSGLYPKVKFVLEKIDAGAR